MRCGYGATNIITDLINPYYLLFLGFYGRGFWTTAGTNADDNTDTAMVSDIRINDSLQGGLPDKKTLTSSNLSGYREIGICLPDLMSQELHIKKCFSKK